jgi:tape measure domain-containing protein
MTDFTFRVVADASKADQAISSVEQKLKRLPTAAQKAESAMGKMGDSLKKGLAAAGIAVGVREVGQMANEFQNLQNRLRYLAGGDMAKVNSMFSELQGVASRTRADLSSTTEAFVRMSLATKQMGLSTNESMQLTERLNQAIALSGASGAEASAGMIQLSQGLASGALRGDELRSVMESLPGVADVLAKGMGVTRGQLRDLGADGKITAEVIVDSFRKAGASLDKDFGNTVPTISQSFVAFKNEIMVTVGKLDAATGVSKLLGSGLSAVMAIVQTAIIPVQVLGQAFGALGDAGYVVAGALGAIALANPLIAVAGLAIAIGKAVDAFDDIGAATGSVITKFQEWDKLTKDVNSTIGKTPEQIKAAIIALDEMNIRMTLGAAAADAFRAAVEGKNKSADPWANTKAATGIMADLTSAIGIGAQAWEKLTEKQDKHTASTKKNTEAQLDLLAMIRARLEAEEAAARNIGNDSFARDTFTNSVGDALILGADDPSTDDADRAYLKAAKAAEKASEDAAAKAAKAQKDIADEAVKQAQRMREAWLSSAGAVAGSIAQMAMKGEMDINKLGAQLLRLGIQMAALSIGGGGGAFLSSFAGGLTGFATGGQFMVGGAGGTDQNLVAFRASNNERVTVETPQQQRDGTFSGGGGRGTVIVNMQNDRRDLVHGFNGRDGAAVLVNLDRKYRTRRSS